MIKIKEIFSLVIKNTFFKHGLENVSYLPRWIVLFWDLQIVIISLVAAGFITNEFSFLFFNRYFLPEFLLGLLVTLGFFLLFKTYVGLIRHSSYIDAAKLFLVAGLSTITLAIVNGIYLNVYDKALYNSIFLIIYPLGLFVSLFFYRVIVKQVYSQILIQDVSSKAIENVFILGTSQNAISTAVAIENEHPKKFKILGFLDKSRDNNKKRIFDLPILFLNRKAHVIIRSNKAKGLIVSEDDLKDDSNLQMIEDCIDHNIKIFRAPTIAEFDINKGVNQSIQNIQIEDLLERKPIKISNSKILDLVKDKVVFVTGGAGSIGSEIVNQVAQYQPKLLVVIDQAETPLHALTLKINDKYKDLNFDPIVCDIRNHSDLKYLFETFKPDLIYHCAAYKHVPLMEKNPFQAVSVNIMGTKNLADLSVNYNVERFVMISTDKAVNPSNVMGASKRVAELYVQSLFNDLNKQDKSQTKFITTRFGNVLGSNGSVVPLFKKQIANGGPVTITHRDIIRYFMTIPEACQLVIEASSMGNGGEIFIFDMGKPVKIIDLATKMIRLAGYKPDVDIKIETIGLRPGEKLYEELLNDKTTTLPTYHEKIMIVKQDAIDYQTVNQEINKIIELAHNKEAISVIKNIKTLVPEYKSLNSDYEKLDNIK